MEGGFEVLLDPLADIVPGNLEDTLVEITQFREDGRAHVCNIISAKQMYL